MLVTGLFLMLPAQALCVSWNPLYYATIPTYTHDGGAYAGGSPTWSNQNGVFTVSLKDVWGIAHEHAGSSLIWHGTDWDDTGECYWDLQIYAYLQLKGLAPDEYAEVKINTNLHLISVAEGSVGGWEENGDGFWMYNRQDSAYAHA